ncbi:MAG: hypothetical protein AAGK00_10500 [Pseudomonadota bacterium]
MSGQHRTKRTSRTDVRSDTMPGVLAHPGCARRGRSAGVLVVNAGQVHHG